MTNLSDVSATFRLEIRVSRTGFQMSVRRAILSRARYAAPGKFFANFTLFIIRLVFAECLISPTSPFHSVRELTSLACALDARDVCLCTRLFPRELT